MKFHKNKMLATFAVIALALAVGACSSNGNGNDVPVASDGDGNGNGNGDGNGNGNGNGDGDGNGDAPTVTELFVTAQASSDAAGAAGEAAAKAVKDAMGASKLTTLAVNGDSMVATDNAQAILAARDASVKAVMYAQTALDNAKAAMVHAEALADDDASKASLIAALEAAIMMAESNLEAATENRDGEELEMAVEMVTGDDPEAKGYPMTPADHGKVVAMAIGEALGGMSTAAVLPRGKIVATAPDEAMSSDAVRMNDHTGKTWAEIVGAAKISKMRITRATDTTEEVDVASIAGMTGTAVNSALTDSGGTDGKYDDGTQTDGSNYNGIPGTAICAGSDCVVGDDGKLAGSWFFTPMDGDAWYLLGAPGDDGVTMYAEEMLYAQFGYWLTVDETGVATINRYALVEGVTENGNFAAGDDTNNLAGSANYVGPAAGMSVYKTVNADSTINTIDSAAFTATVNLKATFGVGSTLGGTVTDFVGDAVGDWTVELQSKAFTGTFDDGTTVASGRNGVWSATSYGEANERPTGIFGGFNAHFSDGHAAGVYATRK